MSKSTSDDKSQIPTEFTKIIYDLINDIVATFPEYTNGLDTDLFNIKETKDEESIEQVYNYVKRVIPERFFDILYKNEEIFSDEKINTQFLPGIEFKNIWKSDISETTKETIWKYLQLMLFTIIGKVDSQDSFGDTAKLFESINEDELKQKLEDTLGNLQNMLDSDDVPIDVSGVDQLPNSEQVHDHISGLLDGKLGKLAKEIAEETAAELNFDAEGATSVNDVFQSLFKNPGKLMNLVKNVGGKLDDKIKSGEIKESEIMAEASGLLGKMKDVPGMGDIQSMMKKMGMSMGGDGGGDGGGMGGLDALSALSGMMGSGSGGMGGMDALSALSGMMGSGGMGGSGGGAGGMDALGALGGLAGLGGGGKNNKLNLGAMQNAMEQNMKSLEKREKMKERMNEKADKRRIEMQLEKDRLQSLPQSVPLTDKELEELVFSIEGEKAEKSVRPTTNSNKNKKKKKGKK
jgi:hypothetical protein